MGTATIAGGAVVTTPLTGLELQTVQNALAILSQNQSSGVVLTDPKAEPTPPGSLFIYNFPAGKNFKTDVGASGVVLSQDNAGTKLTGPKSGQFLVAGNNENDTLTGGGGNGTIVGGNGNNYVVVNKHGSGGQGDDGNNQGSGGQGDDGNK